MSTEPTRRTVVPRTPLPLRAVVLSVFLTLGACGVTDPDLDVEGVVRFVAVEGGCWAIDVGDERVEPINLPEAFQRDGLEVTFSANEVDAMSICQIGRLVQIQAIDSIG